MGARLCISDCILALQLQVETVQKVPVLTRAVWSAARACVNLCAWARWLWSKTHQQRGIERLSRVSILFMKHHELKSICRSRVLRVPKDNPLTGLCLCHPSSCACLRKKKKRGANTIFIQISKEYGDGTLEKWGTVGC